MDTTRRRLTLCLLLTTGLTLPFGAEASDWSRFRGPNGSGVADGMPLPTRVGPDTHRVWASPVPFGRSSPAVGQTQLFLTAVEDGRMATMAFDRTSGSLVWKRSIERSRTEGIYKATDSATPSPVTDGVHVFAFFQEFGLVSYDSEGRERWRLPLGPFRNFYGTAASPVLADGLLILVCDQAEGSFVLAVDAGTGEEVWRQSRSGRPEAYATPILFPSAASPEVVLVLGSRWIDAYDPKTGTREWSVPGLGSGPVASLTLVGDTVFASAPQHAENGWPEYASMTEEYDSNADDQLTPAEVEGAWLAEHFGWLDTDGNGSLSEADWTNIGLQVANDNWGVYALRLDGSNERNVLWNYRRNVPYIPTPLAYGDDLYLIKDNVLTTVDLESGTVRKQGRLTSGAAKVYASPVAGDGKVYVGTLGGELLVLTGGGDWTVAEANDLGSEIWATPAISDGHLYVRTATELFDFALPPSAPPSVEPQPEPAPSSGAVETGEDR